MKPYCFFVLLWFFVFATSSFAQDVIDDNATALTLQQAVEMALENNLDILVSRLDTQVRAEGVTSAKGFYRPFMSATINTLDSMSPAQNQLIGAQTLSTTRSNYNFTWQQELSTGGQYTIQWSNFRSTTNSAFSGYNPLFNTVISGQVVQPLLQNFRNDVNRQQIMVAQNGERISRYQFQIQVMNTVRDVEFAYWDLVFSIRDLDVAHRSLALAEDLLRNNRIQVEVGTMAPIDILEAEAEVAARGETVILAEEFIRTTQDILKLLINNFSSEDFWKTSYRPVDKPQLDDVKDIDMEEAVRIALERQPVLKQSQVELETRDYNVQYSRNQLMPQLDFVGGYASNGVGGTRLVRQGFATEIEVVVPGGYSNAINQVFDGNFRDWSAGLNISYPLGNSRERAQHAEAQVAARQQRTIVASNQMIIAQEVRQTARAVESNRKRINVTRVARELAERRLDAEQKKFDVGTSTSFLIVQAQRDLAQADANELRALIDYAKALAAFEHAKGTNLRRLNISVN